MSCCTLGCEESGLLRLSCEPNNRTGSAGWRRKLFTFRLHLTLVSTWHAMTKIHQFIVCIMNKRSDKHRVIISHLGLHIRTAGLWAEGGEVAQGLGLLLETHDAVLLEHDEGGMSWSRCHYPLVDVFSLILTLSRERFMTWLIPIYWCVTIKWNAGMSRNSTPHLAISAYLFIV